MHVECSVTCHVEVRVEVADWAQAYWSLGRSLGCDRELRRGSVVIYESQIMTPSQPHFSPGCLCARKWQTANGNRARARARHTRLDATQCRPRRTINSQLRLGGARNATPHPIRPMQNTKISAPSVSSSFVHSFDLLSLPGDFSQHPCTQ